MVGIALRNSPVFLEVKKLMTELKTQLSDFAQNQQQQRQEIVNSSCKSQRIHHEKEAQWTHEKKQKILKLASQQRELLKLLHCNKNLVEKVQTLKEMAKLHTKKVMPIIEVHHKSLETNLAQGETDKNIHHAASTKTRGSNLNQHGATTFVESQTARIFKQTQEQSARRFNQESSSLNQSSSGTAPFHHQSSTQTVNPSTSQLTASPLFVRSQIPSASPNHTYAIPLYSTSSTTVSQTSIAKSLPTQQRAHNVILTAGQLYQVGDKQIYVLPHGLNTDIVSSMTATQVNQKPQGTSEATSQTKTVSAGPKEMSSSLVTSVVKSIPRFTQSRASNFILHSQTQVPQWHPTCISPLTYTGVTAPLSLTPAPRNNIASALPKDDTQSQPSTSSAVYQNTCTDLSVRSHSASQGSKQLTNENNETNENNAMPLLQNSGRIEFQHTKHSFLQSTNTTSTSNSKLPVSNFIIGDFLSQYHSSRGNVCRRLEAMCVILVDSTQVLVTFDNRGGTISDPAFKSPLKFL